MKQIWKVIIGTTLKTGLVALNTVPKKYSKRKLKEHKNS